MSSGLSVVASGPQHLEAPARSRAHKSTGVNQNNQAVFRHLRRHFGAVLVVVADFQVTFLTQFLSI